MKSSSQDRAYLQHEADAFFERNAQGADPATLRPKKRTILAAFEESGLVPRRVLEYGCNYGDLLNHLATVHGAVCHGVEPSARAVELGRTAYGDALTLHQGTVADNPVNADPESTGAFDLVVIDDVFCWVSRETLFQSVANVDDALADGGFLFIREFLPLRDTRNRNHHVADGDVHCYKPAATHARMFTASGVYTPVWQKVTLDAEDAWARDRAGDPFESRWVDTLLRKSLAGYWA